MERSELHAEETLQEQGRKIEGGAYEEAPGLQIPVIEVYYLMIKIFKKCNKLLLSDYV